MTARDDLIAMVRRICPPHLSMPYYAQITADRLDAVEAAARADERKAAAEVAREMAAVGEDRAAWACALVAAKLAPLAAAGQAPAPECATCGHGQHTGPCTVLVMHPPTSELHGPVPCSCEQAPAPCCHLHKPDCCDPEDCGPCCEDCPTCPTLRRQRDATPRPAPQPDPAPGTCARCGHGRGQHADVGLHGGHCDNCQCDEYQQPDAEPGTPDATREHLRQAIAAAIRAESSRVDDVALADAVLAVRDDALTTAQHVARGNLRHVRYLYRALTAAEQRITDLERLYADLSQQHDTARDWGRARWEESATAQQRADIAEQRITAALALCDRAEQGALRWADPLPVPEWVTEVRTALAPPTGQDGDAS